MTVTTPPTPAAAVLALHAGPDQVRALVLDDAGTALASTRRPLGTAGTPGDRVWQAVLAATRDALGALPSGTRTVLRAVGLAAGHDGVLLWDRETLGSPGPPGAAPGPGPEPAAARLRRWAGEEPNTWALVRDGRYAIGTLDSYLVARMTRGTWHVTDVSHAAGTGLFDLDRAQWSPAACAASGVPMDALPEVVPTWGDNTLTDSRSFLGLELPVAGLTGDVAATLVGRACLSTGEATAPGGGPALVALTGSSVVRGDDLTPTTVWKSPDGLITYAAAGELPPSVGVSRVAVGADLDEATCQTLADRLAVPVDRSTAEADGADVAATRGAGYLAGLGAGVWSADDLRTLHPAGRRFLPLG